MSAVRKVWVEGKPLALRARSLVGSGGEAEVYAAGRGKVVKLFKGPDHPDFSASEEDRRGAERRLADHQTKLTAVPGGLPGNVVVPEALATDAKGQRVLGYRMPRVAGPEPLFRLADPSFRRQGVSGAFVVEVFRQLHATLRAIHACGAVVGDFNDANVLVAQGRPWVIDVDSWQFGGFPCRVFTERFVDPLLCDPAAPRPVLVSPYTPEADWYAYHLLLMRSLLLVGPYGGVYRPADPADRVPHPTRPLKRITVFHPEVRYPKPALPPEAFPPELIERFREVFERDVRGPFPLELLEDLDFASCPRCQLEHARLACPRCRPSAAAAPAPAVQVSGAVQATRLFATQGVMLACALQGGVLRVVHHEDGAYRREDGAVVFHGPLDPSLHLLPHGEATLAARGGELLVLRPGRPVERRGLDAAPEGAPPPVASDGEHVFWVEGDALWRDGSGLLAGPRRWGEVLGGATRIWVGPGFGLGLYRAGSVTRLCRFGLERPGLDDGLEVPRLPGLLLGVRALLDAGRAWVVFTHQHRGRVVHRVRVYEKSGAVSAAVDLPADGTGWACQPGTPVAAGGFLLAASDAGLERLEVEGGALRVTRRFPGAEPFVDAGSRLLAGPRGLVAAGPRSLHQLVLGTSAHGAPSHRPGPSVNRSTGTRRSP